MKKLILALVSTVLLLGNLLPAHAYVPKTLRVGFTPWENPDDLAKTARSVVELLQKATGMRVESFLSSDYSGVVQAMQSGRVDVAFYPPVAYVLAEKKANARVIIKSQFKGQAFYYSAIITRKDTGITSLKGLKGHTFAFVDPSSTSGAIYPKVMVMNQGLNVEKDFPKVMYAGTHEAVVLALLNHHVDAGAVFANDPKAQRAAWTVMNLPPAQRDQIRVLGVSQPIPADNISVRADLDPALIGKITKAFLDLSATPAGRAHVKEVFRVDGFVAATPADYAPVREAFSKLGLKLP